MKHNKLSISIVSAFIAALGLSACSNATSDEKAIVTINYDGTTIPIKRDDIYGKLVNSEDGVTSFYNAILEVLIRNHFEKGDSQTLKQFEETAHDKVAADHKKAKSDSKANNTSYDDEWQAILDANGVKDEEGLYQKHLYSLEKEDFADKYFDSAKKDLTSEYIGFDSTGKYLEKQTSVFPYHVRHILVSTEGSSATDYVSGLITEAQAKNLTTVFDMLVKGTNTFGEVAFQKSEDPGSQVKYGDSGIMSTKTSFVNEFKLGLYAYDTIYANPVTGNKELKNNQGVQKKLGLDNAVNNPVFTDAENYHNIQKIPAKIFDFLKASASVTTNTAGNKVNDGAEKYYPRNIIWNRYFNYHNPFVIVDNSTLSEEDNTAINAVLTAHKVAETSTTDAAKGQTGFRNIKGITGVNDNEKVLTDENGKVIVGVRSEFGIHFMVMERTPFEIEGSITGYENNAYTYNTTNINEYYTTNIPSKDEKSDTYVSHLYGEKTDYAARASEVKNEIKGFDALYDYRLFESLEKEGSIKINDPAVEKEVEKLIQNKRANILWTNEKDMDTAWDSYIKKLERQKEEKTEDRLIKLVCATNFENPDAAEYKKGTGECYYEA